MFSLNYDLTIKKIGNGDLMLSWNIYKNVIFFQEITSDWIYFQIINTIKVFKQ